MFTLGSDPEIFAVRRDNGIIEPAFVALGGDLDLMLPYGTAYCDGAAIEFTVQPTDEPNEVVYRIWDNLHAIQNHLPNHRLSLKSNADIGAFIPMLDESYGKRASLQILGCQKDQRVYDWVKEIERPDPKVYPYRTIGTHIHIELGAYSKDWALVQFITAFLDAIIGTAGVYVLEGDQAAKDRNILYGKAGTIRVKEKDADGYDGLEYRCLPTHAVLCNVDASIAFFTAAQQTAARVIDIFERDGYSELLKRLGGVEQLKYMTQAIDEQSMECFDIQSAIANNIGIDVEPLRNTVAITGSYLLEV